MTADSKDRKPLRAALVGYGLGGSAFHAPFLDVLPEFELAAVVTGNPKRQAAVRERYPSTEVVADVDELFARSGEFDVAVVTVPNKMHVPLATAALESGLHVVLDKPVAGTADEARGLVAAAEKAGRVLCAYQNRRFDGDFLTLEALLREGRLGSVHRFESRFERWRPEPKESWKEDADPAALGSILYDLGAHLIDQAVALFGRPESVYAELDTVRPGVAVEDDVFLALTHPGGVRSHLWMSATAADLGPRLRVLGSKAAYVKYGLDVQEAALRDGSVPDGPGWGVEPEADWGRLGVPGETEAVPTLPGAYAEYYRRAAAAMRGEAGPPVPMAEMVTVLEVVDAAHRSAREGGAVALG